MRAAADARSGEVQGSIANGTERSGVISDSTGLLRQWAEATLTPFGPPVPPPDRRLASPAGTSASISFEPRPKIPHDKPRPIRIHHEDQARKLVRRVEPIIAGDPFVDNRLRFVVVIGPDGLISTSVMISGNCWLERFGTRALQQWLYEPTAIDDKPIEVVTEVWLTVHN